jgi:hypothetical protein
LAIESKERTKQKWMLAMNVHIILLQASFHIYLSLNSKTERFYSTPNQEFFNFFLKGNHFVVIIFLENGQKRKKCFLGFPNHQNFRNLKIYLQIFVLCSPRKQTISFSFFVHSLICFNCLMSGCHFSCVTGIEFLLKINKN